MCCGCDTSYIVSVHIQCQSSVYTLSLRCGHSWRVRLAKQEALTPPGHLVSPLIFRGPWMSTVVLFCWCHSDSASVLLYFTLLQIIHFQPILQELCLMTLFSLSSQLLLCCCMDLNKTLQKCCATSLDVQVGILFMFDRICRSYCSWNETYNFVAIIK